MINIKSNLQGNELTLFLNERIDTTNALEVEESLNHAIEASGPFEKLILDACHLVYISSVGLRVLLRLKKAYPEFEIINASNDVYDVLEMTGFTSMMEVRKAYRVLSIEGCPLIGEGYFGRVYRISPDTIVKMYFRTPGTAMPIKERERAKMAFILGIPTAISYEVVRIDGTDDTYGAVFELVDAQSMDGIMKKDPSRNGEMADIYFNLMKTIFNTKVGKTELASAKDYAREWLKVIVPFLGEELGSKVTSLIESIPDDDFLIHGDCHMKNIFVSNGEPILIDMETISRGNHIFEYAPIYGSFFVYDMANPNNNMEFFGLPSETVQTFFNSTFRRIYGNKSDEEIEEMYVQMRFIAGCLILYRILSFTPNEKKLTEICMSLIKDGTEKLTKIGLD